MLFWLKYMKKFCLGTFLKELMPEQIGEKAVRLGTWAPFFIVGLPCTGDSAVLSVWFCFPGVTLGLVLGDLAVPRTEPRAG